MSLKKTIFINDDLLKETSDSFRNFVGGYYENVEVNESQRLKFTDRFQYPMLNGNAAYPYYGVPSAYNGFTFCMGCYQLAGDNLYDIIHQLGEKIFFVHARDVIRKPNGFDETSFGKGEVDIIGVLRSLRDSGYQGLVCPEHLPRVDYDPYDEIASAWGLGYLAATLSVLEE